MWRGLVGSVLLLTGLGAPAGARAQPLLPSSSPLTSLLRPHDLDNSTPLLPRDATGPGAAVPCERISAGAATRGGARAGTTSLAYSGAGPGEYGRYFGGGAATDAPGAAAVPGYPNGAALVGGVTGADAAGPAGALPPTRGTHGFTPATGGGAAGRSGADRPLYGGVDRPLWDVGPRGAGLPREAGGRAMAGMPDALGHTPNARLATAGTVPGARTPGVGAHDGEAQDSGAQPGSAAPPRPNSLPLRDRPLWSEDAPQAEAPAVKPCLGSRVPPPGRMP